MEGRGGDDSLVRPYRRPAQGRPRGRAVVHLQLFSVGGVGAIASGIKPTPSTAVLQLALDGGKVRLATFARVLLGLMRVGRLVRWKYQREGQGRGGVAWHFVVVVVVVVGRWWGSLRHGWWLSIR